MSNAPERPYTESVTVVHSRNTSCDSIYQHYGIDQDIDEQPEPDSISFTCDQSVQPNEQFYCTDSNSERAYFGLNKTNNGGEVVQEEDKEEEEERNAYLYLKQAAEVAAAARFISKADVVVFQNPFKASRLIFPKSRLRNLASIRDSITDNSFTVSKARTIRMQPYSSIKHGKGVRPPPLQLAPAEAGGEENQTPLPTRISSKGAPSFDLVRPVDVSKQLSPNDLFPGSEAEPKIPPPILTPESANTFQFDFVLPTETPLTEPQLSRSESGATTDSQSPPTPPSGPIEDHIRRDIEAFVLEQKTHLRGSSRRMRRQPAVDANEERLLKDVPPPPLPEKDETRSEIAVENEINLISPLQQSPETAAQTLRRKKSIFGWLQKKPEVEVDELIDLYMNDEQKEVKTIRAKPSKARLTGFRNRVTTDPLPMRPG